MNKNNNNNNNLTIPKEPKLLTPNRARNYKCESKSPARPVSPGNTSTAKYHQDLYHGQKSPSDTKNNEKNKSNIQLG